MYLHNLSPASYQPWMQMCTNLCTNISLANWNIFKSKTDYSLSHTYFDSFFVTIIEHTATMLRSGRSEFRMLARIGDIELFRNVKTDPGLHLSSYSMGAVVLIGGKWPRSETAYSIPSSAQVREWTFTSAPLTCFHGVDMYSTVQLGLLLNYWVRLRIS